MITHINIKALLPVGMILMLTILTAINSINEAAVVRTKDICKFQSERKDDLIGYAPVIGPDCTGDESSTRITIQSPVNIMKRLGVTVDANRVKVKNVAAVMITGRLNSQQPEGSYIDITVSSFSIWRSHAR